jgi:hypothetical protein
MTIDIPENLQTLAPDSIYVHTTPNGMTLNFMQSADIKGTQKVVAAIGMSERLAHDLVTLLRMYVKGHHPERNK